MKAHKILTSLALAAAAFCSVSCYESYVKDYDFDTIYFPYQFDLRTFIVGEGMKFDMGVELAGTLLNDRDRKVDFEVDPSLLTENLGPLIESEDGFTAYDILSGASTKVSPSQKYVLDDYQAANNTALEALPASMYTLSNDHSMVIAKGRHTATVTVKADSLAICADEASYVPHYVIPLRIKSVDADKLLPGKSYVIMVVRVQSMFFGTYYQDGTSKEVDPSGKVVAEKSYESKVNDSDAFVVNLTSVSPYAVTTNTNSNSDLAVKITLGSDNKLTVSSADGKTAVTSGDCFFNGAKLLQDRKLHLNYSYVNAKGNTVTVSDVLSFRNRIEDGVNIWQDMDPSHYDK
jgi:hypothetical protein